MKILNNKFVKVNSGFSLLELSVVISITAIVVATTVNVIGDRTAEDRNLDTIGKLEYIARALQVYSTANTELPCPADITDTLNDNNFGVADCATALESVDSGNVHGGMVPVTTLGLPTEYSFDEWGRRIVYVVDENMTNSSGWLASSIEPNIYVNGILANGSEYSILNRTPTKDELGTTVDNCTGGSGVVVGATEYDETIPMCAAYLLLSHGQNGSIAIDSKGGSDLITSAAIIGTDENENSIHENETLGISFDNKFIDKDLNDANLTISSSGSSLNTEYFDDILLYRTKRQVSGARD